jgi:hypothetical protein
MNEKLLYDTTTEAYCLEGAEWKREKRDKRIVRI